MRDEDISYKNWKAKLNKTKSRNYLFSNSIDFIYEFFNFESKTKTNLMSKSVQFLGKNKLVNKFFTKLADNGMII